MRHHSSILVLQDVAVVDELAELRERDAQEFRVARAVALRH